jgi:hypothetical protein
MCEMAYPDPVRSDDEVRRRGGPVLEGDRPSIGVYICGPVVDAEGAGRAVAWFFKGRFEELFVQVDAVEVVIVLHHQMSNTSQQGIEQLTVPNRAL